MIEPFHIRRETCPLAHSRYIPGLQVFDCDGTLGGLDQNAVREGTERLLEDRQRRSDVDAVHDILAFQPLDLEPAGQAGRV